MRRNLDEAIDVVFCYCISNPLRAGNMNVFEAEVLGGIVPADEIVDDVGVADGFFDRLFVAEVHFLWSLSLVTVRHSVVAVMPYQEDDSAQVT